MHTRSTRWAAGMGAILALNGVWAAAEEVFFVPAGGQMPGIVGHDDRRPVDSKKWPWQALGRINQPEAQAHCSGALIARDAVLTAAHCVFDYRTRHWLAPGDIVFVAGLRREEDAGYARGRAIRRSPRADPIGRPSPETIAQDWAIVYLDRRLPIRPIPVHALPFGPDSGETPAMRLQTAGYALDRPFQLSVHDGCRIVQRLENDRVFLTDCDSTRGDSGAPLLLRRDREFWLVGVFSAATSAKSETPGSFAVHAEAFSGALSGR